MIVVLTGVSGSGKTTVGRALAERLGWAFVEGDDFHPPANVRKMESGRPLTEEDREPWLAALGSEIARRIARGEDTVVTCSCLRARHRSRLRTSGPSVRVVHLGIDRETAEERVSSRGGHYFGAPLVESQFEALEEPERARVIDAGRPVEEIVEEIVAARTCHPSSTPPHQEDPMENGRTSLVTGSSRGIGRAAAIALAGSGHRVILTARGEDDLEAAAREVAAAGGPAPRVETCDFGDARSIDALFDRLAADGVAVDVLVNNVGIARIAAFEEVDDEEWDRNWRVNVMSAVRCSRRVVPEMAARGWGRVVNVSSSAGKRPSARWPAYAPTKAALQALTMVLAAEYAGAGVTVNAVCPGPVRTPMWTARDGLAATMTGGDRSREDVLAEVGDGMPIGRMAEPGEIGAAIAFLCSEGASYVTGSVLSADGGNVRIVV